MAQPEQKAKRLATMLDELGVKLFDIFSSEYSVQIIKNDQTNRVTVNNYNTYNEYYGRSTVYWEPVPWYPYPGYLSWHPYNVQHVHHHYDDKKDDNDKDKKRDNFMDKLIGTIIVAGTFIITTVVLSKDGYIAIHRYSVLDDIKEIELFNLRNCQNANIDQVVEKCKLWLDQYRTRVKKLFYGKALTLTSGLIMGGSYYLNNNNLFFGSILCGTLSGCYYLWNRLGWNSKREAKLFFEAVDMIIVAKTGLETEKSQVYPDLT